MRSVSSLKASFARWAAARCEGDSLTAFPAAWLAFPPPPFTPHHAGISGGRFRITLAGLPNFLGCVFRSYD